MAKPKVFISSTCYDLREIRDSLSSYVRSFGFEPILSEHGDVFYHPDLHTHDSCIHEVGNCQLFILIIGGRFGGRYVADKEKSITNAEYEAAVSKKIPVFTYVKRNVLDNHQTFQTNRDKEFINELHFPAIENQEDAIRIFEFINRVRRSPVNNSYETFETCREIESHLRKQWSAMFFNFLKEREVLKTMEETNDAVHEIKNVSKKLEEIIKNVYRVVDKENAEESITKIEIDLMAKEYLSRMIGECLDGYLHVESESKTEMIYSVDPQKYTWWQYLIEIGLFEYSDEDEDEINLFVPEEAREYLKEWDGYIGISVEKKPTLKYQLETAHLYEKGYKLLDQKQRAELLRKYLSYRINSVDDLAASTAD